MPTANISLKYSMEDVVTELLYFFTLYKKNEQLEHIPIVGSTIFDIHHMFQSPTVKEVHFGDPDIRIEAEGSISDTEVMMAKSEFNSLEDHLRGDFCEVNHFFVPIVLQEIFGWESKGWQCSFDIYTKRKMFNFDADDEAETDNYILELRQKIKTYKNYLYSNFKDGVISINRSTNSKSPCPIT